MVDWMSITVFFRHLPIPAGRIIGIHPDGGLDFDTPRKAQVRGSYESTLWVRSQGDLDEQGRAAELYIDGNPSKFLQGHNVFGSDDLTGLLRAVLSRVVELLDLGAVPIGLASAKVHRLDFTHSFCFDSRADARLYVSSLALRSHGRMGRPNLHGYTCYFGQHSRRWSFKLYTKGDELDKHKLPEDLPHRAEIYREADNLVRAELTLRSLELKRLDRPNVHHWTPTQLNESYREYVGRLAMSNQLSLPSDVIKSIRRCYRDTYFMWNSGITPRGIMSQNTFYTHRRELLRYGVDIAIPRDTDSTAEIIPLVRLVEGKPYQPPEWAYSNGLIFQPNRKAA